MGKFLDKFKGKTSGVVSGVTKEVEKRNVDKPQFNKRKFNPGNNKPIESAYGSEEDYDDSEEDYGEKEYNDYYGDEVGVQPAQKPESFHHFILENQYKDLEKDIRGYKDVWNKEEQKWITKRKDRHCFTDEEAEMIVRMAQSHLSTDIKLSRIKIDSFGLLMNALYKQMEYLFERIAEYNYGRYGGYDIQGDMKAQNLKIFNDLWNRIQANYSRAIDASENKATHQSVRGQESLQGGDRDYNDRNRGYS